MANMQSAERGKGDRLTAISACLTRECRGMVVQDWSQGSGSFRQLIVR
jgi:hypothetical protein